MARREEIARLRLVLIKRRDSLCRALREDMSLTGVLGGSEASSQDLLDPMDVEIDSQLAEIGAHELVCIQEALKRMDEGGYGVCESCGSEIALGRLNALPFATRCINCQREAERNAPAVPIDRSYLHYRREGDLD